MLRKVGSKSVIVGIDEAGRGSLAGPVVAGACVLIDEIADHPLITDSKQMTFEEREEAFTWIEEHCTIGFGVVENAEVDAHGILGATEKAMHLALAEIEKQITPTYLLVDGRDKFWFNYPHSSVIRGDESEPCISAASIVAKVVRDRIMIEYHNAHPEYGFNDNKGYGAPQHLEALEMFGVTTLHRKTFLTNIACASA